MLVPPSPKLHAQVSPPTVAVVLLKVTVRGVQPDVGLAVKATTGLGRTRMVSVIVSRHPLRTTIKETILGPGVEYTTGGGANTAEVAGAAPAPKFQA